MGLSPKLALKQTQSLVMTPQLMQSIRLLQYSSVELNRFIEEEIERNPLLEAAGEAISREVTQDLPDAVSEAADMPSDWMHETIDSAETMAEAFDQPVDNLFSEDSGVAEQLPPDMAAQWKSAQGTTSSAAEGDFDIGDIVAAKVTLREHVHEQIAFAVHDANDHLLAMELADGLEPSGYLGSEPYDAARKLGLTNVDAERVLSLLQTFDPPGLFARTLAECLSIQLKARDRFDPAMEALVANLDLLAKRDFVQLRRICGVDDADILDMLKEIRALDPKPGTAFETGTVDSIVPDVTVRAAPDGSWAIELNPAALPRVLVNQTYYATVSRTAQTNQDKEFLTNCLQTANWLTKSLDQRAKTILKVAKEIVKQQDGFLAYGVSHLRPLNLKTVADAIKMHESTVSRVTANKFMDTPRGVFELRYFFTASISSSEGGDAHSAEAVRHKIRQMIEAENPQSVLSDDQIVDALVKSGIEIARRTVAKYRESMNIASSVQRRREKRATAAIVASV